MVRELYEKIQNGIEVRKCLSDLRQEIKGQQEKAALKYLIAGRLDVIAGCLNSNDAKTRKNAALLLGEIGDSETVELLFETYKNEQQLFVKSSYLLAILNLDYRSIMPEIKESLDFLEHMAIPKEEEKHRNEEKRLLSELILKLEPPKAHVFCGVRQDSCVILLTNRDYKQITMIQIKHGSVKEMPAGVLVKTNNLDEIFQIRTYFEMLFLLKEKLELEPDSEIIAKRLFANDLLPFLAERHTGRENFYFRLEIRNKMPLNEKSHFAKKIAAAIERESCGALKNRTGGYEVEIRLVENSNAMYFPMIKLYTIPDMRFSYRIHSLAASIRPENAALIIELAKPYMKEKAQVLDPFCGVGTMLIERNLAVTAGTMYGLDIYKPAIDGARENAKSINKNIYYIQRDVLDFKHEYLFDEIISNLPFAAGKLTKDKIKRLYSDFILRIDTLLKPGGLLILHTKEKESLQLAIKTRKDISVIKQWELNRKEKTNLYILKFQQERD